LVQGQSVYIQGEETVVDGILVTIWEYDKTFRKLVVYRPEDDNANNLLNDLDISGESTITIVTMTLIGPSDTVAIGPDDDTAIGFSQSSSESQESLNVEAKVLNLQALHHFEDDDGLILNPNNDTDQDWSGDDDSRLQGYISSLNGLVQEPDGVVTNYAHEHTVNDAKRTIKLIKPEFAPMIQRELGELL
jgi:hypothetical protein